MTDLDQIIAAACEEARKLGKELKVLAAEPGAKFIRVDMAAMEIRAGAAIAASERPVTVCTGRIGTAGSFYDRAVGVVHLVESRAASTAISSQEIEHAMRVIADSDRMRQDKAFEFKAELPDPRDYGPLPSKAEEIRAKQPFWKNMKKGRRGNRCW